jgi:short-subunit dehydrogenase
MATLQLTQKFPGKRAFITGAGSGLGRELALLLGADGWTIGITDINQQALNESRFMIESKGGKVYGYLFDVSDRNVYKQHFDDYVNTVGGLDLIVNNAGVGDGGLFEEYELDNWEWITGINQMAVVYGCHFALKIMKKQGYGQIINIASAAGYATMPNMSMYNVTKAAVIALSESIYSEAKPFGVGVSVVMPTFFRTNIMQHGRGPESAMSVGSAIVKKAPILPSEVALKILNHVGKGKFHIFHPFQAKLVWYLKRFTPGFFLWVKAYGFQRKEWVTKKILERK